jgi:glycosyltransferase involved in cell wall biosynthesis
MQNRIQLTIGIPVYNGSETISATLDSIIQQLDDNIEILVSDNASTDKTQEIVKIYASEYACIKYFRNDINVGGCKNLNLLFERANGDFVWILGDDDRIKAGGVKKVLEVISKHPELAFIFVNLSIWNRDFSVCYNDCFLKIEKDRIYQDANEYFDLIRQNAAFTPTQVINRRLWLELNSDLFNDTGWKTLFYLFLLLPGRKAYIIAKPYALFADGSTRHHKDGAFYYQIFDLIRLFNYLPKVGYNEKLCKNMIKSVLYNLPITIYSSKLNGLKINRMLLFRSIKMYGKYSYFWLFCLPIFFIPSNILWFIHNIYIYLKKTDCK